MEKTKDNSDYQKFDLKELKRICNEIFTDRSTREQGRRLIVTWGCRTFGSVTVDLSDPDIKVCKDSECRNCQRYLKAIDEHLKEFVNKLDNKKEE